MAGWTRHTGQAAVLPLANVDTDQLIPARFMSVPRSEGYGDYLMYDLRRKADGTLDHAFALNGAVDASVLIAGANFGTGSSREAAVYALVDAGFMVVIAPSFGDIFESNAVNNGLLPARVDAHSCAALTDASAQGAQVQIDLQGGRIHCGACAVGFSLDESWRTKLINGWDDIDLTQTHASAIAAFKESRRKSAGWVWSALGQ